MLHRRCCWEKRWQSPSCETKNIPITRPSWGSHSRSLMAKPSPYKAIELERQAPRVGSAVNHDVGQSNQRSQRKREGIERLQKRRFRAEDDTENAKAGYQCGFFRKMP